MKRTFIAFDIEPSETVREVYETVRKKLRNERINWIDPGNLHITLKFLGDTSEESIPSIIKAISKVIENYTPLRVILKGLGVFRNIHDPHVFWMGCKIEDDLLNLKQELEVSLNSFGYETEKRAFSPHLTLGRIKLLRQTNHLSEILASYRESVFQEFYLKEIVYYQSRLTSSGSVYTSLGKFTIAPARS